MNNDKILRRPAVMEQTGLSNSTIYYFISLGKFPKPLRLGQRSVGWRKSEIDAWIESREHSIPLYEEGVQWKDKKGDKTKLSDQYTSNKGGKTHDNQ